VLQLACEAIVDFADVCVEQRNSIRHAEMDWSTWDAYFRYLFQNSPVLQRFLRENKDFYPDYLTSVFGYIVVRVEHTGEVASEWQVEESEEGLQGYPWIRTWLITKIRKDKDKSGNTTTLEAAVQAPDRVATTVGVPVHVGRRRCERERCARASPLFVGALAAQVEQPLADRQHRRRSKHSIRAAWADHLEASPVRPSSSPA
jgi:hypothetical protein